MTTNNPFSPLGPGPGQQRAQYGNQPPPAASLTNAERLQGWTIVNGVKIPPPPARPPLGPPPGQIRAQYGDQPPDEEQYLRGDRNRPTNPAPGRPPGPAAPPPFPARPPLGPSPGQQIAQYGNPSGNFPAAPPGEGPPLGGGGGGTGFTGWRGEVYYLNGQPYENPYGNFGGGAPPSADGGGGSGATVSDSDLLSYIGRLGAGANADAAVQNIATMYFGGDVAAAEARLRRIRGGTPSAPPQSAAPPPFTSGNPTAGPGRDGYGGINDQGDPLDSYSQPGAQTPPPVGYAPGAFLGERRDELSENQGGRRTLFDRYLAGNDRYRSLAPEARGVLQNRFFPASAAFTLDNFEKPGEGGDFRNWLNNNIFGDREQFDIGGRLEGLSKGRPLARSRRVVG